MTDNRQTLRFKRWSGNDQLPLPAYTTDGAAGFDFNAALEGPVVLQPGERKCLRACVDYAKAHNCDFILFDRDAEVIANLPSYSW